MTGSEQPKPVCLTIGGSDSCGGAGIQADLRVFAELGVTGCSAITALTAQNPKSVHRIEAVSLAQLDAEIHALFEYYDIAAVKTGMLLDAEHVAVVSALLSELHAGPVIVDPVMVASSGSRLLNEGGVDALSHALIPQAMLVTPNLDEAAVFLGREISEPATDAKTLADELGCAVLLKGGHGADEKLTDLLCDTDGNIHAFNHARQAWSADQCHGTGCRLAAAITAQLAQHFPVDLAVEKAVLYLQSNNYPNLL